MFYIEKRRRLNDMVFLLDQIFGGCEKEMFSFSLRHKQFSVADRRYLKDHFSRGIWWQPLISFETSNYHILKEQ